VETDAAQNPFKNIQALLPAYSRPVSVGFLVDKVALVHVLLRVLWVSPVGVIPPTLRTYPFIFHRRYVAVWLVSIVVM